MQTIVHSQTSPHFCKYTYKHTQFYSFLPVKCLNNTDLNNFVPTCTALEFFKNIYLFQNHITICLTCLEALRLNKCICFSFSRIWVNFSGKVFPRSRIRSFQSILNMCFSNLQNISPDFVRWIVPQACISLHPYFLPLVVYTEYYHMCYWILEWIGPVNFVHVHVLSYKGGSVCCKLPATSAPSGSRLVAFLRGSRRSPVSLSFLSFSGQSDTF